MIHIDVAYARKSDPLALFTCILFPKHLVSGIVFFSQAECVSTVPSTGKKWLVPTVWIAARFRIGQENVTVGLHLPGFEQLFMSMKVKLSWLAMIFFHKQYQTK